MDEILLLVIMTGAVLLGNVLSTFLLNAIKKNVPPVQKFAKGDIINILDELNALIKLEFIAVVEAPNTLRQIDVISDVAKIQKEVVNNVTSGLSTKFLLKCNDAGLKKSYIYTYITRKTLYEIWGYMREHNFTPKKG